MPVRGLTFLRVSAADKGWWVYPLDPYPDSVTLYSGCIPVTKLSTSTQAHLLPSISSVTVASSSESQPPISLSDTASTTSNSLSTSVASFSSNKALSSPTLSICSPLPAETKSCS
ncbi:hypothetical protein TNCV_1526921 [Trichonephila clavipes]|nr:hypothetical protein TNCV_1526921 [Trichonephila clavipes]